jgi:magnesium and cobalt exporter, CNNM family
MNAGWWLIAGLLFSTVAGLFASLALSLHTLSKMRMTAHLQDVDDEHAPKRVQAILEDIDGHAAAVAFVRSLLAFSTGLCMVYWASAMRHETSPTLVSLSIGLPVGLLMLWIFATLIPMGVANHAGERAVIHLSPIIRAVHILFVPLLPASKFINEVVRRLVGVENGVKEIAITGSDIRSIVEDNEVEDKLDETERDMLEAVVEFRSTSVEQIMTPRTEINALRYTDDLSLVQAFVDEHGHSRHPVYSENLDHIEGMLYAKDLLRWIINHGSTGEEFVLSKLLREPTFVPETKTVRQLLTQLLNDNVHIAIILDEYGGTSGLVTMEDIVEEIFGEIQDEYDDPKETTGAVEVNESNKSAEIDARTEIDDANDQLDSIGIELPESDDYDTVGGFINTALGRIPEVGEQFDHELIRFEILEAEPTKVIRLKIWERSPEDHLDHETEISQTN